MFKKISSGGPGKDVSISWSEKKELYQVAENIKNERLMQMHFNSGRKDSKITHFKNKYINTYFL